MSDTRKTMEELEAEVEAARKELSLAETSVIKAREKIREKSAAMSQWYKDVEQGDEVFWRGYNGSKSHRAIVSKVEKKQYSKEITIRPILKNGELGKEKKLDWSHSITRINKPVAQPTL